MKVSDLMVGDWVICNHYQDKPFTKQFGVADFAKGEYEFCEPIPLTEEILVKNGFSTGKTISGTELFTCEVTHQLAGDGFEIQRITIYPKWICYIETTTTIVRTGITYVHQLQHLLRLCGIEKELNYENKNI